MVVKPSPGVVLADQSACPPAFQLQDVTLRVGRKTVLDNVSYSLSAHGALLLRGPNGAGKSTLMKALVGLLQPAQGSVRVLGRTPDQARGHVGYMVQKAEAGAPMLPALSHVAATIGGQFWGLAWPGRRKRAALALLGLTGAQSMAGVATGYLSGGEMQRVALASALSGAPRLLLLDEPLAALDPQARHEILSLLKRLREKLGFALVMTAHESLQASSLGPDTREAWLCGGRLSSEPLGEGG
ncbi:ATP-binding cassette domain-containing protein [Formicincola oecophyllae]|uniref:ATP-binding cassette domain-containing protein n=1 Tax=Formicincola oecophyllae TaxID=2558361 RepID=A0A4Y6UAB3_9PROT|nr:ATP-binding cassette domain-containing protein [Formicincola oecophyllae]QDH13518.1 ATP-binding cassette domain-containing protein [Formicincola oecophyllae]